LRTGIIEQVIKYFDGLAPNYFDLNYRNINYGYPVLYLRQKYILEMLSERSIGRALDIGCGSGAMLIDLHRKGYEVVGGDISVGMTRCAKSISSQLTNAEHLLGVIDIEHLPFINESFGLVVCAGVIEYLERDENALKEVARVLRHNGVAFITVTNITTPFWFVQTMEMVLGLWKRLRRLQGFTHYPKRVRLHFPTTLKKKTSKLGLDPIDEAYFHFSPLPFPLNQLFAKLCRLAGLKMEAFSKTGLGFLGRGYILKTVKRV
jgi:ubiquinone/menaquinone biosynthesis C-methylase UbiE